MRGSLLSPPLIDFPPSGSIRRVRRGATRLLAGCIAVIAVALLAALAPREASSVPVSVVAGMVDRSEWDWPLAGLVVVERGFSAPPQPWQRGHRGVDLSGRPGLAVLAAGAGVVAFAGQVAGRGVVSIDHPGGLRTTYEPVEGVNISEGASVQLGQQIGVLSGGHAGCTAPACLHWGLRRGQTYLDPLLLVRPRALRLKPLTGEVPRSVPAGAVIAWTGRAGPWRGGRSRPRCCRSGRKDAAAHCYPRR